MGGADAGAALEVEDLEARYGPIQALKGVSFRVPEGTITALIGANGAGKTTLLRTLSGLLRPSGGRVRFRGREIQGWPPHRVTALGMSHVPEGRAVLGRLTVEENLLLGAYPRHDREVEADKARLLERFPALARRLRQPAGTLSGGEQQMLAIARALMARPRLLLLDEPSMGLAPQVVVEIFSIIREINAGGTTVLLVEQNARQALRIADAAHVLETGRLVLSGPACDLLQDPAVIRAYLGGGDS